MTETQELYFNKAEGLEYAKKQGYPFGKSKFYADLKYVPRVDNKFAKKEIDKYIKGKVIGASGAAVDGERKAELEVQILEEDLRKKKFKNDVEDGEYILRTEVELIHSAKLQHLMSAIDGFFQSKVPAMVTLCEGNKEKVAELRAFCIESLGDYFDDYATPCVYNIPTTVPTEIKKEIEG